MLIGGKDTRVTLAEDSSLILGVLVEDSNDDEFESEAIDVDTDDEVDEIIGESTDTPRLPLVVLEIIFRDSGGKLIRVGF